MKLNTEHIDLARKYFLSKDREERSAIEDNLQQTGLLSFLQDLKQAFNSTEDNSVTKIMESTGNEEHLHALLQIQEDYYIQLAVLHISGISNADIITLVDKDHIAFFNEVNFQKELIIAMRLNERSDLRRKFEHVDEEGGVNKEEINIAFKLGERKNLKEQFLAIENEFALISKPAAPVIHFNWKRFAIAASLITLILTITFVIFNNNKNQHDVAEVPDTEKRLISDSIAKSELRQKTINDILAGNEVAFTEIKDTVIKETSLGFGAKNEIITMRLYFLNDDILKIDQAINGVQGIKGFEKAIDSLKSKKTSLINLENRYRFYNDSLLIYLYAKKDVKVFKIDTSYFIQVGVEPYYCTRSSSFLMLKPAGKTVANKINELIY